MEVLAWLLPELGKTEWLVHALVFVVNILLLILAGPIVRLIDANGDADTKIRLFRSLNVLVLLLHVVDLASLKVSDSYQNYFINLGLSLMCLYAALFVHSLGCKLIRRRFGLEKTQDETTIYLDTYSTRMVELILLVIVVLSTVYALIKIWGADSLLETTGIFGILFAFLAFTSNIWAPDIVSGLIILNTRMLEDGDVVVVDGYPDEYLISKVTLIYVILYDVRNNHRTLIRNSQFTQRKIDNLSRVASTDGVRRAEVYKIGYPQISGNSEEQRQEQLTSFTNKIDRMFSLAYENCSGQKNIKINEKREFEWALTLAGDYALEYTLWIYLERIPNTKVTSSIRRHLMGTEYLVNEQVYRASVMLGIDLFTPTLSQIELQKVPIPTDRPDSSEV